MKTLSLIGLLALFVVVLAGCTAMPNTLVNTPNADGKVAGFWQGLWHGIISPVTFIISLFNHNVTVFEVHNNGAWYILGFLAGVGAFAGGGGRAAGRRR